MGTEKRERQKAGRAARVEAAMAAQKRAEGRRRIWWIAGTLAFIVAGLGVIALVMPDDDDDDTATAASSTVSTAPAVASVAGQPCVELADPLPTGAPNVPVEAGPPPTELVVEDLVEGTGDVVPEGATVTMHYIGVSCSTGAIFDSSYSRGEPLEIPLDQVIEGWSQGVPGMKVGGQRLLVIPPDLGYGETGGGSDIAPGETLWFVVEAVSFQPAGAAPVP
jgi:peptidylprolyl isomerase